MCYAIPGKVISIDGKTVTVGYFGETKNAINEMHDLKPGDYVYAQGGYAIQKVPEKEALDILDTWAEMFQDLRETDVMLSKVSKDDQSSDKLLNKILDRVTNEVSPSDEDLKYLLALNDEKSKQLLYKTANFLRQKHQQNSCCVHGIIELSNRCIYNCSYCGIGAGVKGLPRYKMSLPEVMEAAGAAIEKYGFKVLVLQTGDGAYSVDELIEIIQSIKAKWPCLIFISAGETGVDSLEKLWNAGARGILMRFETSNSELYATLHPGMDFNTRLTHLRRANELGYLILTGSLIGVPGQTEQDIINDIRLAKELNAEMFSFGPFLPSPGTPLAENSVPDKDLIIKTLAVARLIDPEKAKILITTALETLDPASREKGLMAGGNSVMLNVTPMEYRKLYSIYPNRAHAHETITEQINVTIDMLKNIGRAPTDLSI